MHRSIALYVIVEADRNALLENVSDSMHGISLSKRKTALAQVEGRSVSRAIWRQLGNLYNITGLCQNLLRTLA